MIALGYIRASTADQAQGLDAQRHAIEAECERRSWALSELVADNGRSGRDLERPGMVRALHALSDGRADALVVAKLDRLTRSMLDFATLAERSRREGWALVALDLAVDTTTPAGEAMANVLATFAQFERRMISLRTREALAERKRRGLPVGRPSKLPAAVVERIVAERREGRSCQAIADALQADGIATGQGGAWRSGTVWRIAKREEARSG